MRFEGFGAGWLWPRDASSSKEQLSTAGDGAALTLALVVVRSAPSVIVVLRYETNEHETHERAHQRSAASRRSPKCGVLAGDGAQPLMRCAFKLQRLAPIGARRCRRRRHRRDSRRLSRRKRRRAAVGGGDGGCRLDRRQAGRRRRPPSTLLAHSSLRLCSPLATRHRTRDRMHTQTRTAAIVAAYRHFASPKNCRRFCVYTMLCSYRQSQAREPFVSSTIVLTTSNSSLIEPNGRRSTPKINNAQHHNIRSAAKRPHGDANQRNTS